MTTKEQEILNQLLARFDEAIIKYAEGEQYQFVGKHDNKLYFLDISGCPFSCNNIHFMQAPYDGKFTPVFAMELYGIPDRIVKEFAAAFYRQYGFAWRKDLSDEEISDGLRQRKIA